MHTYIVDGADHLIGPVFFPSTPGFGEQLPSNAIQFATKLAKPLDGRVWALVEGQPQQIADYRGTVFSTETGAAVKHTALGELPPGLTTEPKPSEHHYWQNGQWVEDLNELYDNRVAEINGSCEQAITSGFTSSALGTLHHYTSKLDDQLNLTGAVLRGLDMPYACRDEQGVKEFRLHTAEQLRQVGDDFTLYKLQLLQHANKLKQQLDLALATGDVEAMALIRWETVQP